MTATTAPAAGPPPASSVSSVGRGGAINLIGAAVYGASNFLLLYVINHSFDLTSAGVVLTSIAVFNVLLNLAQLGCSTGFIRWTARHRALAREDLLRATLIVGLVPVVVIGIGLAVAMFAVAPVLAHWFINDGSRADLDGVTSVLRAMAPFLPLAAVYNIVVQATRGFDTMVPQTLIEKVGRALALPVIAWAAVHLGLGTEGTAVVWAASNVVALIPAGWMFYRLITRAVNAASSSHTRPDMELFRSFWVYTAPRAVGQVSEVIVNWLDTVLVAGIVSRGAATIYASGTRYLLPGQFTADALMQVSGPRISGLLAAQKTREAEDLLKVATAWQTMLVWPMYLLVIFFARPLLRVFGPEIVKAETAVIALSLALLFASLLGPVQSVILMSGRSRQAMFNTIVLVIVNVGGNLLLVPRYGLNAAGVVWAVTIVLAVSIPGWQSYRYLGIVTAGPSSRHVALAAVATVGVVALAGRLLFGPTALALLASGVIGGIPYTAAVWRMRERLELPALLQGFSRRRSTPSVS